MSSLQAGLNASTSLRTLAIRGAFWTLGAFGVTQVLRLGSNVALAYLLFPEAFGLMALVSVFLVGLEMFSDVGIHRSIVQNKRGADPAFLNTAWTIQVIRGFVLWICACILAWPAARFYGEPLLMGLLAVAGLTAVIRGLTSTSLFTLNREVKIGPPALLGLCAQVISIVVMISWAMVSPTVWALVGGGLVLCAVTAVGSHCVLRRNRDRIGWDRQAAREILRFGSWIFASSIVTFIALSGDRLILGRMLSINDLGLYSIALVFTGIVLATADRLAGTVLFPILSRQRHDPARMVSMFLEARRLVLWASASLCAAIALAAPLFFDLVYDPRYAESGRIAQWLVLFTWTSVLVVGVDLVPLALGNSKVQFQGNLIRSGGIIAAVAGYLFASLPGFIVGLSFGGVVAHMYLVSKLPHGRSAAVRQSIRFSVGLALFVAVALAALQFANHHVSSVTAQCLTAVLASLPCLGAAVVAYRHLFGRARQRQLRARVV